MRGSPRSKREVTREIQGLPASDALNLLRFVPKKAAGLVRKTLASAVANAENNNNLNVENLVIQEAVVGEGPTAKRFQPKACGSAGPIRKRTSHIKIILTDEIEIKRREKRDRKKSKNLPRPSRTTEIEKKRDERGASPAARGCARIQGVNHGTESQPNRLPASDRRDWSSKWYASRKDFADYLLADGKIRGFLQKKLKQAAVARIVIERAWNSLRVTIHTARPGSCDWTQRFRNREDDRGNLASRRRQAGEDRYHRDQSA